MIGQRAGSVAGPRLEGGDELALVNQSVLQGEQAEIVERLQTDREQSADLRALAADIFASGAEAVVVVPSMPPQLASQVLSELTPEVRTHAGTRVELVSRGERFYAVSARTFADAPRGALILYEDSYRNASIAVSRGSAAGLLGVEEGSEISVHLDVP